MKRTILFLFILLVHGSTFAQPQDAEGCKDNPLFNRMQNTIIDNCQTNFNAVEFQTGAGKKESVEGNVNRISYYFNTENGGKLPSPLQIIKNYENAIIKNGGKKIYQGVDDIDGGSLTATFRMESKGKKYYVSVRKMYEGSVTGEVNAFDLLILEQEAMTQEIQASEMFEKINNEGHIALYINFETGKSDIKAESDAIINQIAAMMKSNPSLKISVEGHTDNIGATAANKTLSENRARAVVSSLITKGIDKTRLTSKGLGADKPIADNNTEDGLSKNRRVEIVKCNFIGL
jgi:OmpA-OmpF porin, OOP family